MNKNFLILQFGILALSGPAIFAKGINIDAGILIWWRCMFGAIIAFTILFLIKKTKVSKTELKHLIITGFIMGLHWWTYFLSIQLSTVAIGILSLFTYPIISVFLEPFFFKTKISIKQVLGGLGIIVGIYFLVPEFTLANDTTLGIAIGLISAFLFSLRGILTRKHLTQVHAVTTMGYHILFSFIIISALVIPGIIEYDIPTLNEAGLIVILASFFTIGSHGIIVYSFKHYTVSTIGILGGLQVIYGAVLGFLFFSEIPTSNFYIGAIIIIGISIFEMLPNKIWNVLKKVRTETGNLN